jgi:polysaccharide biosynthesis/export protein
MSHNHNRLALSLYILLTSVLFESCVSSKETTYFNDRKDAEIEAAAINLDPILHAGDLVSITVSSLNPESALIYNTPNISAGNLNASNNATVTQASGYLVNQDGAIQFPVLGNLQVADMSKRQLTDDIRHRLIERKLLVDPIVTIRYLNFRVTVIGEVAHPTVVTVPSEQINVLEAIGLAGDLTIFGRRDNVLLVREDGGKKIMRSLNLNSTDLLKSPYYYLKSNDVIYVEPNKAKISSSSRSNQILPIALSGLSFVVIILDRLIK